MSKTIKIPGRIESVATGKVVTGANFILDDTKGKKQNVINEETDAELLRLDQEKQGNLTFDQTPTEDSTNPVTSGGVYAADLLLSQAIEAILLLIPSAASELNKLVDLATMNSSISTATASFKGTYNLVSDLHLTVSATHAQIAAALDALSLGADNNDYAFVQVPNTDTAPTDIAKTERYKFNGENWAYEYDLNNSGFTTAQWNAINSGITTLLVAKLSALPTNEDLTLALAGKQDNLTFDNAPTAGSNNPVKSGGIYTRNNEIVALINALDAAKQNVLTFDTTPTNGSTNPVTSNGVYLAIQLVQTAVVALDGRMGTAETKISTAEGNIANLQAAYAALTQSDIVVVSGALPSSGQQQNIIYRQPDQDHTPPQFYSDYMWNGTAWVLMATYNNAIDPRPKKASQNLVTSGGVFDNMGAIDVSELNASENPHTLKPYATLDAALADIPSDYQKGGMSIKYVQTSDNKYVQYHLLATTFSTNISDWQNEDDGLAEKLSNYIARPTWSSGYIANDGTSYDESSAYVKSAPLSIKAGSTIKYNGTSPGVAVFAKKNANNTYTVLLLGSSQTNNEYTTTEDIELVVTAQASAIGAIEISYPVIDNINILCRECRQISEEIGNYKPDTTWSSGYILPNGTSSDSSDTWVKTSPIPVKKGETIKIVNSAIIGGGVAAIAKKNSDNTYTSIQSSDATSLEYSYTAEEDCNIIFTSKASVNKAIDISFDVLGEITSREKSSNKVAEINENANNTQYPTSKAVKDYVDKSSPSYNPAVTWSQGYILPDGTSSDTSDTFEKSSEISLSAGNTIVFYGSYNGGVAAIAKKNNNNTYTALAHTSVSPCSYTAEQDCIIVLSRLKNTDSTVIIKNKSAKTIEVLNGKVKFIDCLGDSLTMGSANFGYFEDTIQTLVGDLFTVRNWGVGGEKMSTIMARQGCDGIVFPNEFELPANGSTVEVARSTDGNYMTSLLTCLKVTPLMMGSVDVINPCYINGIECTMSVEPLDSGHSVSEENAIWYLKRNVSGDRNVKVPTHQQIYFNTGKSMGSAFVSIIWMGANGGYYIDGDTSEQAFERYVHQNRMAANAVPNGQYIIIGLHKAIGGQATHIEEMMQKEFGNKFYNIRLDCITNMIYDAGITPTSQDLEDMANGVCPQSLLYDGTHFKPASNAVIGARLYNMMVDLGYIPT